jgi:hypothetical protein
MPSAGGTMVSALPMIASSGLLSKAALATGFKFHSEVPTSSCPNASSGVAQGTFGRCVTSLKRATRGGGRGR